MVSAINALHALLYAPNMHIGWRWLAKKAKESERCLDADHDHTTNEVQDVAVRSVIGSNAFR